MSGSVAVEVTFATTHLNIMYLYIICIQNRVSMSFVYDVDGL